jgi:hypothetical protein
VVGWNRRQDAGWHCGGVSGVSFRALINWPLSVRFTDHLGRSVGSHELPDMWDAVVHVISHWDEDIAADRQ